MRSFLCRVIGCISIPLHSLLSLEQSLLSTLVLLAGSSLQRHRSDRQRDEKGLQTRKMAESGRSGRRGLATGVGGSGADSRGIHTSEPPSRGSRPFSGALPRFPPRFPATAAFLSTSAGVAVFSAGVLAGGAGYAGSEIGAISSVGTRCGDASPATSMAQLSQRVPNRRFATVSTCFSSTGI